MIYYFTPLHAAGAITEDEIQRYETLLQRYQFTLLCNVKSEDIKKLLSL